tara:strand:+ start:526 stop:753 length:228 start_codon:yes stop_codon:yes gene_type:complete
MRSDVSHRSSRAKIEAAHIAMEHETVPRRGGRHLPVSIVRVAAGEQRWCGQFDRRTANRGRRKTPLALGCSVGVS